MTDRSPPTGPPRGPQWGPPAPSGKSRRRPALTHTLAALGGLTMGVLIGIVSANGDAGGEASGSRPTAAPATRASAAKIPSPDSASRGADEPEPASFQEIPGDGTFLVGQEVRAGTYRSDGPAGGLADCYWARLKGTTGDFSEIIANAAGKGPATVTILATDKAFQTSGCQTWKRLS
ncbi:hypothetical protein [Streptomyces sp. NPDC058739]|uniref:hypothetical protein n=1 Tax=Streptomyces sp. NPDC058739 TaxID=3346618 RepID=UPI0036B83C92